MDSGKTTLSTSISFDIFQLVIQPMSFTRFNKLAAVSTRSAVHNLWVATPSDIWVFVYSILFLSFLGV